MNVKHAGDLIGRPCKACPLLVFICRSSRPCLNPAASMWRNLLQQSISGHVDAPLPTKMGQLQLRAFARPFSLHPVARPLANLQFVGATDPVARRTSNVPSVSVGGQCLRDLRAPRDEAPLTVSVYATPLVGEGFGVRGHTRDLMVASSPLSHVTVAPWTLNRRSSLATMIFPCLCLAPTVLAKIPPHSPLPAATYIYCIDT